MPAFVRAVRSAEYCTIITAVIEAVRSAVDEAIDAAILYSDHSTDVATIAPTKQCTESSAVVRTI